LADLLCQTGPQPLNNSFSRSHPRPTSHPFPPGHVQLRSPTAEPRRRKKGTGSESARCLSPFLRGGEILDTPFFPICRTQLDVRIRGDWERLAEEIRGFHWMVCYGDYLRELGYAVKKAGLDWLVLK